MQVWAQQYTTQVTLTFMPELYPGMRIRLADHNIEVYVMSVIHQGDFNSGFSTQAQVTCPVVVTTDEKGQRKVRLLHYGFPMKPNYNSGNNAGGSGGGTRTGIYAE